MNKVWYTPTATTILLCSSAVRKQMMNALLFQVWTKKLFETQQFPPVWALIILAVLIVIIIAVTVGGIIFVLGRPAVQESSKTEERLAAEQTPIPASEPVIQAPPQIADSTVALAYLECQRQNIPPLRLMLYDSTQTIGRALDNDMVIDDRFPKFDSVSRYHATIRHQRGMWIIYDEGKTGQPSSNGVFVEGRRTQRNSLRTGWLVTLGSVEFVFSEQGGES